MSSERWSQIESELNVVHWTFSFTLTPHSWHYFYLLIVLVRLMHRMYVMHWRGDNSISICVRFFFTIYVTCLFIFVCDIDISTYYTHRKFLWLFRYFCSLYELLLLFLFTKHTISYTSRIGRQRQTIGIHMNLEDIGCKGACDSIDNC